MKAMQRKPDGPINTQKKLDLSGDQGPALNPQRDTTLHATN